MRPLGAFRARCSFWSGERRSHDLQSAHLVLLICSSTSSSSRSRRAFPNSRGSKISAGCASACSSATRRRAPPPTLPTGSLSRSIRAPPSSTTPCTFWHRVSIAYREVPREARHPRCPLTPHCASKRTHGRFVWSTVASTAEAAAPSARALARPRAGPLSAVRAPRIVPSAAVRAVEAPRASPVEHRRAWRPAPVGYVGYVGYVELGVQRQHVLMQSRNFTRVPLELRRLEVSRGLARAPPQPSLQTARSLCKIVQQAAPLMDAAHVIEHRWATIQVK